MNSENFAENHICTLKSLLLINFYEFVIFSLLYYYRMLEYIMQFIADMW